ncbi:hypothetical protein BS78_06G274500 [Paspalum vaginatum]|nr:hypothetical protein BS78_06G274500 [Paspalum vaginatum]
MHRHTGTSPKVRRRWTRYLHFFFLLACCAAHQGACIQAVAAQTLLLDRNTHKCVQGRMCICLDLSFEAKRCPGEDHQCCDSSANMSDLSRTVPQEQLPSQDLCLSPTPVINLGHLSLDSVTRSHVVNDITKACRDLGYFQVINHGISQSVMDCAVKAASDFFQLPSEIKEEFASEDFRQPVRYDTSSKDGISMSRAFLKHYAHPLSDWIQYWPQQPPIYREYMGKYAVEARRVALQLIEAILEGLGLGKEYLNEKFQEGSQLLSVNCYPKASQVVDRSSNSWRTAQQLPHALNVHLGDHMEVLSNGLIKTVVHRALLNSEEARISIASIHGFALDEKVTCAKELVDEQNPQKYKESSFSDFLDHLTANMDNKQRNFLESLKTLGSRAE